MTLTTQLVLRALLADPGREMYGREIMQAASLATGTVYPILARLVAEGWVSVREEKIDKRAEGRPARRYYRLTPEGTRKAGAAMARAATQLSRLGLDAPPQAPLSIGGFEVGVTVDERQPPGTVGIVSRGRNTVAVSAFSLGAEVTEPKQDPEPASEGPCEHRIPPGAYCRRCGRLI
jgi:PadR family transcriptional regulator PadR